MKKHLLAGTALVALGSLAAAPALAQIEVEVGGYQEVDFGYADQDNEKRTGTDVKIDGEIHFGGEFTTDNGLSFGLDVQLESQTSGDQIDESFLYIEGAFGRVNMGSENGAAYLMHYSGDTDVGITLSSGDVTAWVPFASGNGFARHTSSNSARLDNDSEKLTYFTPRFYGFQFGASYAPELRQDNDVQPSLPNGTAAPGVRAGQNAWSVGANYQNNFGGFGVAASAGYMQVGKSNNPGVEPEWYGAGLRLSYGAFGARVSASRLVDGTAFGDTETDVIMGGVSYTQGPIGASLMYSYGEDDATGTARDVETQVVMASGRYTLGPGVQARVTGFYVSDEVGAGGPADTDGVALVGGIRLNF